MDCMSGCFCCTPKRWTAEWGTKYSLAKFLYFTQFLITSVATWVLRDYASPYFSENLDAGAIGSFCANPTLVAANALACAQGQIAMRISFGNFCFFALHMVALLMVTKEEDPRTHIHTGFWFLKVLLWLGTLIGFFFVPSEAIYGFAQVARVLSGLFLILQIILLINFIYLVNEWLVGKENIVAWAVIVSGTIVSFCLGLVLIGFSYHLYAPDRNIFFCTWSIIVGLGLVGILFIPKRAPTAGLLTSGCLFLYASYLLISALTSQPPSECIRGLGTSPRWIQIVGFFISLAAILFSTLSAGQNSKEMFGTRPGEDKDTSLPYRVDFFHCVFALASLYIAMLFSNWEVSPSTEKFELDSGVISMWVKIVSKWMCEGIYVWTVVAPAIFQDRDFGYGS